MIFVSFYADILSILIERSVKYLCMVDLQAKLEQYIKKYGLNIDYINEINDNYLVIDLVLLAEHLNSTWDNRLRPKDLVKRYYISLKTDDNFLPDFIRDRDISKVNPILLDLQSLLDTDENIGYLYHKDRFSKSECEKAKIAYWISVQEFRSHMVKWIVEDNKSYLIQCEQKYKRSEFLEFIYGKKRIDDTILPENSIEDDLYRLTIPRRTTLLYNALSAKYRDQLVVINNEDEEELKRLCKAYDDIPSAKGLLNLLKMENGLSKIITFGLGHEASGAAKYTWVYREWFLDDKAIYTGQPITWEEWKYKLISILDQYRIKPYYDIDLGIEIPLDSIFNISLYYQNKSRLTLTKEDKSKIDAWKYQYLKDGKAEFPLSGKINKEDNNYSFTVNYFTDMKYISRQQINKIKGEKSGTARIINNAKLKLKGYKKGQIIKTKDLKQCGYKNSASINRLKDIVLKNTKHGEYEILIDIPD